MKLQKLFLLLCGSLLLISGCFQNPIQDPIQITKYCPKENPILASSFLSNWDMYEIYRDQDVVINSSIYNVNGGVILFIAIFNNTREDISTTNYSITLTDGKDKKPIRMLERSDLIALKSKYLTGSSGSLQDQLIQNTVDTAMKTVNLSTKDKIIEVINQGINNYFSFRPIYAGKTRQGIICLIPDFNLEFPLNLTIKINNKTFITQFIRTEVEQNN